MADRRRPWLFNLYVLPMSLEVYTDKRGDITLAMRLQQRIAGPTVIQILKIGFLDETTQPHPGHWLPAITAGSFCYPNTHSVRRSLWQYVLRPAVPQLVYLLPQIYRRFRACKNSATLRICSSTQCIILFMHFFLHGFLRGRFSMRAPVHSSLRRCSFYLPTRSYATGIDTALAWHQVAASGGSISRRGSRLTFSLSNVRIPRETRRCNVYCMCT